MKKSVLLLFILLLSLTVSMAQYRKKKDDVKWLSISPKAGYGVSMLLNENITADKNVAINWIYPSYMFGGRLGITFGDHWGVFGDVTKNKYGGEFTIAYPTETYKKRIELNSMNFAFLVHFTGDKGGYFEIGPQMCNIQEVKITNDINETFVDAAPADFDNSYINFVIGTGLSVFRTDRLVLNVGLRGVYSFQDLMVNEKNFMLDGFYEYKIPGIRNNEYNEYKKTSPLTIQAMIEFTYFFAFWGNASCGRGRLMFFQ